MVSTTLWTALALSAATAHSAVVPRQDGGGFDLAGLILRSNLVQNHIASTKRYTGKLFPYSESSMEALKPAMAAGFRDKFDHVRESERKCLNVRNSFVKETMQSFFDIVPHVDAPDTTTEETNQTVTITESKAIVNTERLGWNKEESSEIGGSVTTSASGGIGPVSLSLAATVYGNQRTTGGKHGESSDQTEWTTSRTRQENCPPQSICRHITWTYTRTLRGKCFTAPYFDAACANSQHSKGKFSLALLGRCTPSIAVARDFYTFKDDAFGQDGKGGLVSHIPGYGRDDNGIKMPKPGVIASHKLEEDCTFTYTLRDNTSGQPVIVTANIIEKIQNPALPQPKVTKVPKAIGWVVKNNQAMCELENDWLFMSPDLWYIPPEDEDDGPGEWARRAELPDPVGLKKKCAARAAPVVTGPAVADDAVSKRALTPPVNELVGKAPVDDLDLVEVEIVRDDMPKFLEQLRQSQSEGFVANPVAGEGGQPARRDEDWDAAWTEPWEYGTDLTFDNCLGQSIKQNGKA